MTFNSKYLSHKYDLTHKMRHSPFCLITFVTLLFIISMNAYSQSSESQITVKYGLIGNVSSKNSEHSLNLDGAFVGVHNDTLIISSGASTLSFTGQQKPENIELNSTSANAVFIANLNNNFDHNKSFMHWDKINTNIDLLGKRAYGASVSHPLGVIAIGGTDGNRALNDATLIRWNKSKSQLDILKLPPMPGESMNGGVSVVGNVVIVVAGKNSRGPTDEIYGFDLTQLEVDSSGNPIVDGDIAKISPRKNIKGESLKPWMLLPPLPISNDETLVDSEPLVATQYDGREERLYVISKRRKSDLLISSDDLTILNSDNSQQLATYSTLWEFNPNKNNSASSSWIRKNSSLNNEPLYLDGQSIIPMGTSHLLISRANNETNQNEAFSYNTITNAWARYSSDLPSEDVSTHNLVRWNEEILMLDSDIGNSTGRIWSVKINIPEHSLGWLDLALLVLYLLSLVMVGLYFVHKNKNTDDFFRGGQKIPWWAAACSIYATMMSSLSFVALPAVVFRTDWILYFGVIGTLLVTPIAVYIALPFFRQIDAVSAYEYLSKRFNMPVRLFASGLFTMFQIGRMGIIMALTSLALSSVTPLSPSEAILIMGVLSIIYSTLGGVEAVIWTDTIQTFVLLIGGILCIVFLISGVEGGFTAFLDIGMEDNKFRMVDWDFSSGSITTLSIWVILLGGIGQNLSSYTADQAVVQRYMTTPNIRLARKSIWMNAFITVPGMLLFFILGTGLYNFYKTHPNKLDPTMQIDQIFPSFIGAELPIGVAGILIAAIFAAAQSTISTSMNSTATTLLTDFLRPFNICSSERYYFISARLLTVLVGILGTLTGLIFINPEIRSLMEQYFIVIGMFMGALGGLFVLGAITTRASAKGAIIGLICSVGIMITIWTGGWANGYVFGTIGILSCLVIGYFASLILPADNHDIDKLTIYTLWRNTSGSS